MCGKWRFLSLTQKLGKWTWTNDNTKSKFHQIESVDFSVMIKAKEGVEFAITFHVCIFKS